jgi:hypothetical protein
MKKSLILLLGILTLAGVIHCALLSNEKKMISKEQAIEIAKKKFSQLDYGPLDRYRITVTDQFSKIRWTVLFEGVGEYARPGFHVIIEVDKKTGTLTVLPGE